jgi:hypothetical protein
VKWYQRFLYVRWCFALKGVWHEIFYFKFFSWNSFPRTLSIPWGPFQIFTKIRTDIYNFVRWCSQNRWEIIRGEARWISIVLGVELSGPILSARPRGRTYKPFKEPRNRLPAWRAGRTTLLSYRPARLHRLLESIPRNRFLGAINVYKYVLRTLPLNFPLQV